MDTKGKTSIQQIAFAVTRWVGSPQSILVHSVIFVVIILLLVFNVFPFDVLILIFNTAVSLEAIYLALFIQMTVNVQSESLEEVEQNIDEMQEDVEEIQEDIDEIQEDVDELQEDVEDMNEEETTLEEIHSGLQKLMQDVERLQHKT